MHDTTPQHPAELVAALERMNLSDLLTSYIPRERVGVRFLSIERFAARFGYRFERRDGNVYGALRLVPTTPPSPRPVMRLITRSDHAAVHGSRRAA